MTATRLALHAVAELVIAGPQHRRHGTIRMRVVPGGIAGVALAVAIEGAELVWADGRVPLHGATCRSLAAAAGLEVGAPADLYADHAELDADEELRVDTTEAAALLAWSARGEDALRWLAADVEPVLWPEHFDLGVTVGEVNYGVSLGDGYLDEPYAYVGPHTPPTPDAGDGAFWNAPFGAARSASDLSVDALREFFAEGRRQAAT